MFERRIISTSFHEHINFFSEKSFKIALSNSGFDMVYLENAIWPTAWDPTKMIS